MADIKSAHKLIEKIPKNDPLKALHELTSWIESISNEPEFHTDYQLSVLRLLDQAARTYEIKSNLEYFTVMGPQRLMENRLWTSLTEYYQQVSLASLSVLRRYRSGDKGAATIKPELPQVTVRGISAVAGGLKFAVARYAPVDLSVWEQLARFYSTAESLNYLDVPVPVHEGADEHTSVRREIATVLIWYASCAGSFSRLDCHLAQGLSMHLRASFTVDENCGPNTLFDFDLLNPAPPLRVISPSLPRPGRLFIAVDGVQERIEACFRLIEKNFVSAEFNLGGNYDAELVQDVLQRLADCWSLPQQARRNARLKVNVSIKVVTGFPGVLDKVGGNVNLLNDGSVIWEAEDISNGGFSATLVPQDARMLEIGTLVGAQPENVNHWGVGIVRRLSRDRHLNLHAGVELLCNKVYCVSLHEQNSNIGHERQAALWLEEESSGEVSLILQRHAFSKRRSWRTRMGEKTFLLIPIALLEETEDYEFARYRKVAQETD